MHGDVAAVSAAIHKDKPTNVVTKDKMTDEELAEFEAKVERTARYLWG